MGERGVWIRWRLPVAFVILWSFNEYLRTRPFDREDRGLAASQLRNPVLTEAAKLLSALAICACQRWLPIPTLSQQYSSKPQRDDGPLLPNSSTNSAEHNHHRRNSVHHAGPRMPRRIALPLLGLCALLFICYRHGIGIIEQLLDHFTQYSIQTSSTFLIAFASCLFLSRTFFVSHWQNILLQICGFCVIQTTVITTSIPSVLIPSLASAAFSMTFYFIALELIYTKNHSLSPGFLHAVIFTCTLLLSIFEADDISAMFSTSSFRKVYHETSLLSLSQAIVDLTVLAAIYSHGATMAAVLLSLSAATYLLLLSLASGILSLGLLAGSAVVITACVSYLIQDTENNRSPAKKPPHWVLRTSASLAALAITMWLVMATRQNRGEILSFATQHGPQSILDTVAESQITCRRRPLRSKTFFAGNRTHHAFDNVLLIVFFSHARYDVNLDYYQEVYSEFFPNIVFVGPGNREDLGFAHSYDVLVDTYEADEDLSDPNFYRMAGRMAHHMLYTAMREYDCYDGYLWAPFDTLLNVPRLQQFDQRYFWYHSPFGQYVHNPALGEVSANQNASRHAPPANISPDPATGFIEKWRHWGPDWWWGEPHVGVPICMKAYMKVPTTMREHLVSLTNGSRFIGGSADTLYIPGRHRRDFMEILGLFLETDCFLEIATPTVVHLVSPPEDPILYVDHWWIWQPPFNASFVRQQWDRGLEVDTFHTFHWGDKDENGVWRGEPRHIEDVRALLRESAARQRIPWPHGTDML